MIRTTVRLPDELLEDAKEHARRTGRTLTQLLEHAVRAELGRSATPSHVAERSPLYRARVDRAERESSLQEQPARSAAQRERLATQMVEQVAQLQAFLRAQPDLDSRLPDEILGYDAHGLPQ